ncbi:uncharacterized protein LOC110447904 [Mizuhopecten yessoensis]|uniref:Uncharacterized protein n=1 Tax=Mizuhopecten yessoensis TaxID=6573 RepID=A0A210QUA4_MIZYE|nr:uncharacterized protein LOC110447904 [Mizuhopecten yessoensis]OWF52321.1 hypothetical protein KP79_PYT00605 [Mizuhopecten yessoensis]
MAVSLAGIACVGLTIFLTQHVSGLGPNALPLQDAFVSSLAPHQNSLRADGLQSSTVHGLLEHLLPVSGANGIDPSLGRPAFIQTDQAPILLPIDGRGAGQFLPFLPPPPQVGELEIGRDSGLPVIQRGSQSIGKHLLRERLRNQLRSLTHRKTHRNRNVRNNRTVSARKYKSYKKRVMLARKNRLLRKLKKLRRRKYLRNLNRKRKIAREYGRLTKRGKAYYPKTLNRVRSLYP